MQGGDRMAVKPYRRGVILICAALCGALTASLNIWSIFQKPLMEAYGFSPQSVSFAYTIVIAMIGLSGPIGGWLQRKAPAHIIMTIAGIGFGLGWFLTGFASTIPVLYVSFGLLVGVWDGSCYTLALAIVSRWYPDMRGFANGVALAIMAIYPLFSAPAGNMIIENFTVSIAFNIVGVFCIVGFIVLSRFLKMPAADYRPEGWVPPNERGCGQKVGHSGVRIGVRMYPLETRELAVEAVAAGFSLTEAAELAGCSRT